MNKKSKLKNQFDGRLQWLVEGVHNVILKKWPNMPRSFYKKSQKKIQKNVSKQLDHRLKIT